MFVKKIENFTCGNCGEEVKGGGFTNHCPKCLWSKHIDVEPGDRAETCCGLMEPVEVISEREGESLMHKCQKCAASRKNKVSAEDNFDEVLAVAKKHAQKYSG